MPVAEYRTLLNASLEEVWAFHADAETGLVALSPPEAGVEIERADPGGVGAEVHLTAKTPIGRKKWVAVYREWQPPTGSRPHRRAWFVDEAIVSPFKRWSHRHGFEEIVQGGRTRVLASDRIDYDVGYGPIGLLASKLIVRRELDKMFAYRHAELQRRMRGKAEG